MQINIHMTIADVGRQAGLLFIYMQVQQCAYHSWMTMEKGPKALGSTMAG